MDAFLRSNHVITQRNILHDTGMNTSSLAVQIHRLRGMGFNISTERRRNPITGEQYVAYRLAD